MTITETAAIAGLASGFIGWIGGTAFIWGKVSKTINDLGKTVATLVLNFNDCQRRGVECTARTGALMGEITKQIVDLKADYTVHKGLVHQHHENPTVHTTEEWRKTVLGLLERMENSFEKKIDDQTKTLLSRIEGVEHMVVTNGKGPKTAV